MTAASLLVLLMGLPTEAAEAAAPPPDLVVILADDLGFSDLGCYGGEIATPNLNAIAAAGVRLSAFHNTGRCWPTRAALLTGYYPQSVRRDVVEGIKSGGGNRGRRPDWAPLLPRALEAAGYRSLHVGKWHVDGMPRAEGFARSYYLKDQSRFFSPQKSWLDDEPLPAVPLTTPEGWTTAEQPQPFYGTDAIGQAALDFLDEHAAEHGEQPFFLYLAFTAPHFPLHARREDIAKYRGRYDAGWDAIRRERLARQREQGLELGELSPRLANVGSPYGLADQVAAFGPGELDAAPAWDTLTDEQRRFQAGKMEVHAAMVDRMDQQIGRVMQRLEDLGRRENTLVLFLSDNGASAELMIRGDGHDTTAPFGSAMTHLCLGPGWSTAANTPFRYHKTWTHEGGTATPLFVSWPRVLQGGGWCDQVGHVIDLWPTLCEAAGLDADRVTALERSLEAESLDTRSLSTVRPSGPKDRVAETVPRRTSPPPRPGRSLLPMLREGTRLPRELWWSHEGNRGYRLGDWKIVSARADRSETGTGRWELYDLAADPTESHDLAAQHPITTATLAAGWHRLNQEHTRRARLAK